MTIKHSTFFFAFLFAFFAQTLPAQDCPHFKRLVQAADVFWKNGEFEKALNQLAAAREHCPQSADEVNKKTLAFTTEITRKYREAEAEKKRANQKTIEAEAAKKNALAEKENAEAAQKKASEALVLVGEEKKNALEAKEAAQTEKKNALTAKETALAAEKKATDVLDKIYFYEDRYGLAYDKVTNKYGFIDRVRTTKIDFKYKEALPFDWVQFKMSHQAAFFNSLRTRSRLPFL